MKKIMRIGFVAKEIFTDYPSHKQHRPTSLIIPTPLRQLNV